MPIYTKISRKVSGFVKIFKKGAVTLILYAKPAKNGIINGINGNE